MGFTNERTTEFKAESSARNDFFEWLDVIVASMVTVVIIFTFLFRLVTIVGDSMKNTFYENEKVIIAELFYKPKYGDVVVISRNIHNVATEEEADKPIIKRVIATGGQYVNIDFGSGIVSVGCDLGNMKALDEPYTRAPTYKRADVEFPVYVPEGYVFVLGDNRNESKDSRYSDIGENGLINENYILGKAVFRMFPFKRIGVIKGVE